MRTVSEMITILRQIDPSDLTPPLVGEIVETANGKGIVVSVVDFSSSYSMSKDKPAFVQKLRSRLGQDFQKKYWDVTVQMSDSDDLKGHPIWEVDFDESKDLESTAWR